MHITVVLLDHRQLTKDYVFGTTKWKLFFGSVFRSSRKRPKTFLTTRMRSRAVLLAVNEIAYFLQFFLHRPSISDVHLPLDSPAIRPEGAVACRSLRASAGPLNFPVPNS
eukprot:6210360-Pleurochrysis_carterae.AAC.2